MVSSPSDLGGEGNGLLGLVLTKSEHNSISLTPFVQPVHPEPLAIHAKPPAVPQYMRKTNE